MHSFSEPYQCAVNVMASCTQTHTQTNTHKCTCTHTNTYTNAHTHTHTNTYTNVCTHTHTHTNTHTNAHTHTYTHTQIRTHTHKHTHIHTHTHTHTELMWGGGGLVKPECLLSKRIVVTPHPQWFCIAHSQVCRAFDHPRISVWWRRGAQN